MNDRERRDTHATRILLISDDRDLDRAVHGAVSGIPGASYTWVSAGAEVPAAGVMVCDIDCPRGVAAYRAAGAEAALIRVTADGPSADRSSGPEAPLTLRKPVVPAALEAALRAVILQREGNACQKRSQRTQRDRLLEALLGASLKLQQRSAERTNFLARALHDLRAPLTATSGYCGMLIDGAIGPLDRAQAEILERMQHSIQRMSRMANAMFELSLGDSNRIAAVFEAGDIGACVEQAVYEVMPAADAGEIDLRIHVERPAAPLMFDAMQIEQVLINLLDNACRFTPRRGFIEIKGFASRRGHSSASGASAAPDVYRIDVLDSGPGIPADRIASIFDEFVSYAGTGDRSGTGLGLAICRMIVTAHGGEIFATPREDGAMFSVILPLGMRKPPDRLPDFDCAFQGASGNGTQ